ncbi:Polyporopepsin [Rhizoctonia solani]|uniref:Polyporopepsin n=1 Tax=Rhizoctonia solani TaxID=456999 RepID=A0A0K6GDM4_9AGAM|nr:Polyporopepsin [Rhizoctonia solani]
MFSQVLANVKTKSFPISANFIGAPEESTIVHRDKARLLELFGRHEKRAPTFRLRNTGIEYTLDIGIGSPPTEYELALDTGSSYTWIGALKPYAVTKTSIRQGNQIFKIKYMRGFVTGIHYKDLVTLTPTLSIENMPFGVATSTDHDQNIDGVLGLGPTTLNENVVRPNNGVIDGELTLGGTNPKKYTGELNWVGITNKKPLNRHWGYDQTIQYGDQILQPLSAGIADTGTTLILITEQAFRAYAGSIPGSRIDPTSELLEIPEASLNRMKSFYFVINGRSYELTPDAQIWPRRLNRFMKGKQGAYYSVISSLNGSDGQIGFVMGYVFMQRFYTAYDTLNSRIGFAVASQPSARGSSMASSSH